MYIFILHLFQSWISYGYDEENYEQDRHDHKVICFTLLTFLLCGATFVIAYLPDLKYDSFYSFQFLLVSNEFSSYVFSCYILLFCLPFIDYFIKFLMNLSNSSGIKYSRFNKMVNFREIMTIANANFY